VTDTHSDHLPLQLVLHLTPPPLPLLSRPWRALNETHASRLAAETPIPPESLRSNPTPATIDQYAKDLQEFCQQVLHVCSPSPPRGPPRHRAPAWPTVAPLVRQVRILHRRAMMSGNPADWDLFHEAQRAKASAVRRAKRDQFRQAVQETCNANGLWRLARWARQRSHLPAAPPGIPPLETAGGQANTTLDKEEALAQAFFPPLTPSWIPTGPYPAPINIPQQVSGAEVSAAIASTSSTSAPGPDGIPNKLLKAMKAHLSEPLATLTTAVLTAGYHPAPFRQSLTIPLKKPQKPNYSSPKAWRPIALLNTLGKVIEKVLATKLRNAAESQGLPPPTQMGCRPNRSTETALAYLTEQIHETWNNGAVASVLAVDISGAFDRVPASRLAHNLQCGRVPAWVVAWTQSFMDHGTQLCVDGVRTATRRRQAGIPQGSPISPILFLFFARELVEKPHRPMEGITTTAFMDDVTLLVAGPSPQANAARLEQAHQICQSWAVENGAILAPEKYELMHFTRRRGANGPSQGPVQLDQVLLTPATRLRFLGVWLDPSLSWIAHREAVKTKAKTQLLAITRLTQSTWGARLPQSRHLLAVVFRPASTYGHIAWFDPERERQPIVREFDKVQSRGIRAACGAYRSTPERLLQSELGIPPLDLYLEGQHTAAVLRLAEGPSAGALSVIRQCLREYISTTMPNNRRHATATPLDRAIPWARAWRDRANASFQPPTQENPHRWKDVADQAILRNWQARWDSAPFQHSQPCLTPRPDNWRKTRLPIHRPLSKAQSAALIQARTGHIGLQAYLHWRRVPGVVNPNCQCGNALDNIPHWIQGCRAHPSIFPAPRPCCPSQEQEACLGTPTRPAPTRLQRGQELSAGSFRWSSSGGQGTKPATRPAPPAPRTTIIPTSRRMLPWWQLLRKAGDGSSGPAPCEGTPPPPPLSLSSPLPGPQTTQTSARATGGARRSDRPIKTHPLKPR